MASSGATSHPLLTRTIIARTINLAHAGAVISAWDVDGLDDVTVDTFIGLMEDLPGMQKAQAKIAERRMAWLRAHPQYSKHGLEVRH